MRGCMLAGSDRGRTAPALSVRQPQRHGPFGALRRSRRFLLIFPAALLMLRGGGVMVRANWSRIASRNRMRRQGVEDRKDKPPVASEPPKQPRNYLVPRSGSRRHLLHATRPTFHSRRQQSHAEGLCIEAGSGWSPKSTVERWTAFPSSSTMRRKRRFS